MLEDVGSLESWEIIPVFNANRTKVMARFHTSDDAHAAIQKWNGTKIPEFANSKIFIRPQISVKFNVLKGVHNAAKGYLDGLGQIWEAGHVYAKAYRTTDPLQKMIAIRIHGEDNRRVAKAKSALENILAGSVAANGETSLWINFFATPQGLMYVNDLNQKHHVLSIETIGKASSRFTAASPARKMRKLVS